ncbi:sulfotransferase [Nocardioides sp. GXQ0305]|uniref:sulfotransferase n=1 Tax=Nocardioides sp. GXQ0305 TaxID=3423912 RepID=UPI003D7C6EFA
MPRTGTSWLARVLSTAAGYTYYREPDNFEHVAEAQRYFQYLYLPEGADDEHYRRLMERALKGEVATRFTMAQSPGPILERLPRRWRHLGDRFPALYLRQPGILVKLVHSNLALDWLHEHFPDARQVYLVRHPCGQFASWARLGWTPEPRMLLEDDALVHDHLRPYAEVIRAADTFWERAGALWGAVNLVVARQREIQPHGALLQFEWLCEDPPARFRTVFDRLGLSWTRATEEFLSTHDQHDSSPYSMQRRSTDEISKWKAELPPASVEECRRFVEPFDLPWFPDFEPRASDPQW